MLYPRYLNFVKHLLPDMIWKTCSGDGVYITIDDGPTPRITEWVLEELDKRRAKATFFCLGKNIELYPQLYKLIQDAGHKTGNHTYSHLSGWNTPASEYIADVEKANELVASDIFRPPYGRITREQARALSVNYHLVMGGVVSMDYSQAISPQKCLRNVTENVVPGSIIVFHDSLKSHRNMKYAFPRTLDYIMETGMEFRTLDLRKEQSLMQEGTGVWQIPDFRHE